MILSLWQCPDPQFAVSKTLQELISETGLESRSITTQNLVVEGHPFYTVGAKDKTDSLFPKIGVEWESDESVDDLGLNQQILLIQGPIKNKIEKAFLRESKNYEFLDSERFNEFLHKGNGYAETYTRHVESNILITGWATGNAAQKTHLFLYQAVDAVVPYLMRQLSVDYGTSLILPQDSVTLNISNNQFSDFAFGFEIKLKLRQVRDTYRILDNFKNPVRLDIFYNTGKSIFAGLQ